MKKRRIIIILDSESNLGQCASGLELLRRQVTAGGADVQVRVRSAYQHINSLLWLLDSYCAADSEMDGVDVIIAGEDKVAALPGLVDAYLRYHHKNTSINVIGVAFNGPDKMDNEAAVLSITQVPGTQVTYAGQGEAGFHKACLMAYSKPLPKITLPETSPPLDLSLNKAIDLAEQLASQSQTNNHQPRKKHTT